MTERATYRILLVCSGNTCRSSMAEALMRDALQRLWPEGALRVEVGSAGTSAWPGTPASDQSVAALRERGLDLSGHRSRRLDAALVAGADLILTMTRQHKSYIQSLLPEAPAADPAQGVEAPRLYTLREYAYPDQREAWWDILDPVGGSLEVYRATAEELAAAVEQAVARLRSELDGEEGVAR